MSYKYILLLANPNRIAGVWPFLPVLLIFIEDPENIKHFNVI
jgi:hypothetical protein